MNKKIDRQRRLQRISIVISIVALVISVCTFIYGDGLYTNLKEQQKKALEAQQEQEQTYLELAKEYYLKKDYEKTAMVLSKDLLKSNPYALLNLGVMYANGEYFLPDKEIAKKYFYMALEEGEEDYSIVYLLSILDASEGKDGKKELNRIFIKGCDANNQHCEKLLQELYLINGYKIKTTCLEDFNSKTTDEKEKILEDFYREIGSYKQWTAKSYNYYIDEETGELSAEAADIEEKVYKVIAKPLFNHEYSMHFE